MNDFEDKNNHLKPNLLLVEDDKITIDIAKRLLKDKYNCDFVTNGESALIKAKENDYDAFLIDIGLPGNMDGIQTSKELKKIKNNNDKPYIAVTAYSMAGDREFILSEGLTHYISKPFEFKKLIELIAASLENRKS